MTSHVLSTAGIARIHGEESCKLRPYRDQAGNWTVGWGQLIRPGMAIPGITWADDGTPEGCITQETADDFFRRAAKWAQLTVNAAVRVPLTQVQYDVLVSFVYNAGGKELLRGALGKLLNAGKYTKVPDELRTVVHDSKGNVLPVLVERREREACAWEAEGVPDLDPTPAV